MIAATFSVAEGLSAPCKLSLEGKGGDVDSISVASTGLERVASSTTMFPAAFVSVQSIESTREAVRGRVGRDMDNSGELERDKAEISAFLG